ncbi:uncharacterized protein [Amphiura filiformis]|uniref:uncharacterized protein n=1 Tax=Amphiura filiformis TaxID=82378 RepID=UPI003B216AA9
MRREDDRDRVDSERSNGTSGRQPGVGQDSLEQQQPQQQQQQQQSQQQQLLRQQQQQKQQQKQQPMRQQQGHPPQQQPHQQQNGDSLDVLLSENKVGELSTDGGSRSSTDGGSRSSTDGGSRPSAVGSDSSSGPASCPYNGITYVYNPTPYLPSDRSISVPSNIRLNAFQEGLFGTSRRNNGTEPVASVSHTLDSQDGSVHHDNENDKDFVRNLNQNCRMKIKIVLDPMKSIIPDWRNIACKYGVNNDMITYWKSKPDPHKGPTDHLLEYLSAARHDLKVDEFKEVLKEYKRYDVLDILKKQGY